MMNLRSEFVLIIRILVLSSLLLEQIVSSPIQVEIKPEKQSSDQGSDKTPKSGSWKNTKQDLETLDKLLRSSDALRKRLTGVLKEYGLGKKNSETTAEDTKSAKEPDNIALSDNLAIAAGNTEDTTGSDKLDDGSEKSDNRYEDPVARELQSADESHEPVDDAVTDSVAEELDISQIIDQGRSRSVVNPPAVQNGDDSVMQASDEPKSSITQKKEENYMDKLEGALRDAVKDLDSEEESKVNSGSKKQTDSDGNINNAFDLVLRSREYHDLESADPADVKKPKQNDLEQSIAPDEEIRKGENAEDIIEGANEITGIEPYGGDMDLDSIDRATIRGSPNKTEEKRNVQQWVQKLWITRVVPYEIDGTRASSASKIIAAFRAIEKVTCIKFRKRRYTDNNWLRIFRGVGCHSGIGRKYYAKKATDVSLGTLCIQMSVMVHEFLHSLGFFHEQSRPDRNSFLKIFNENIRSGMESNFERIKAGEANVQGTKYDYSSIMHYSKTAFTKNGQDTMESMYDSNKKLGGVVLSKTDILEINKIYQCHLKNKAWSDWTDWSPCIKHWSGKCKKMKQRYCFKEDKTQCQGADKYGIQDQEIQCQQADCKEKFDGHWGVWGSWSSCTKTCDEGRYTRRRQCNNPKPTNGGKACTGPSKDTQVCRRKKCNMQWYDADFESGWGMWQQDNSDKFDWTRRYGGTGTMGTGPKGDHTTGYGYYALIDATPPRRPQEVSRLKSKMVNFGTKCMTFFYSMNGKHTGSLDLFLKTQSGSYVNLWKKAGHQGLEWQNAEVELKTKGPYQLIFEAKLGFSQYSDMAIDDIFIDNGACGKGMEGCQDHNPGCQTWAYAGECEKNKAWMNRECCKSCTAQGACQNKNAQCETWARNNECSVNKKWMWANCCVACKGCLNKDPQCHKWSTQQQCIKNPSWMQSNCPSSCKVCSA